jgi:cellobiose phosphorylase
MFYFWPTETPYNDMFETAESHMNTGMAVAILGDLSAQLDAVASSHLATADHAKEVSELNAAMLQYRGQLLDAFLKDWGSRPFPRRAYFSANAPVGTQEMWLEPQGFTLQIADVPSDRRRKLLGEVERRLSRSEAMGARQIETPVAQPGTEAGSRENGGFWYALNGPLILGAATVDREAAWQMLQRMTFDNFSRKFPRYWTGQWSASDSLDSSLLPSEGLSEDIVPCAHAHAWPLYCYLRLRKVKTV